MRSFYRLTLATLIAVYVLILVGGIVRSTGSGMGCPDWPKCFGSYVPPTSVEELPTNYKDIYSDFRKKKNERFAKYLTALGFTDTAEQLLLDKSITEEADFNAVKTWIEYINRIIGVIIGLLIIAVFIFSVRFFKQHSKLTILAALSLILVVFQGWIGSFVVSTNLTPWTITVHMFLALLLVALLIYLLVQIDARLDFANNSFSSISVINPSIIVLLAGCIVLLLVQILFGTQVREAIDVAEASISDRSKWVESLGASFLIHRSFSWVILAANGFLVFKLWKMGLQNGFVRATILLILGTIFTGVGMAWFAVPPFLQPIHLLLATVTFGVEFLLFLKVNSLIKTVLKN
jgi:cytochrome c oxidase assembly protein subunit 15